MFVPIMVMTLKFFRINSSEKILQNKLSFTIKWKISSEPFFIPTVHFLHNAYFLICKIIYSSFILQVITIVIKLITVYQAYKLIHVKCVNKIGCFLWLSKVGEKLFYFFKLDYIFCSCWWVHGVKQRAATNICKSEF